ncbi:hypothetical protein [Mycolicibacterium llatzerense]|uniref:hypothetical protein n=1 Tax=Mycolicibacterium llatzerense TaxID=280871 RepID=UPI0021B59E59|nr:hypothetical protein [Mycolicibacterium llatzerense]MCT7372738.1 hypothetical protein [Mycolicibacterium llatzerense]
MSYFDYSAARDLVAQDVPFNALIMAAMQRADSTNAAMLRSMYPAVWAEVDARYNAPGAMLPGDLDEMPARTVPDRSL